MNGKNKRSHVSPSSPPRSSPALFDMKDKSECFLNRTTPMTSAPKKESRSQEEAKKDRIVCVGGLDQQGGTRRRRHEGVPIRGGGLLREGIVNQYM